MNRQIVIFAMVAGIWLGQGGTAIAQSSETLEVYTMALTGDSIITRRLWKFRPPGCHVCQERPLPLFQIDRNQAGWISVKAR